ncbi:LytR/AlgR family response regulator transcription factor [Paraphotobacterium marinum]|uniref:LytR/AlgR family response regulator transcription factor n=1 Tax=Paraphotobacterium marinum TaxID=1755811 RepID=UPI0039E9B210
MTKKFVKENQILMLGIFLILLNAILSTFQRVVVRYDYLDNLKVSLNGHDIILSFYDLLLEYGLSTLGTFFIFSFGLYLVHKINRKLDYGYEIIKYYSLLFFICLLCCVLIIIWVLNAITLFVFIMTAHLGHQMLSFTWWCSMLKEQFNLKYISKILILHLFYVFFLIVYSFVFRKFSGADFSVLLNQQTIKKLIQKISKVNVLDNSDEEELVVKDSDSLTKNQNQTHTLSKEKLINKEKNSLTNNKKQTHILSKEQMIKLFIVKKLSETHFISINDVFALIADGNYVQLITKHNNFLLRTPLSQLELKLPKTFQRVHRCHIIDLKRIIRTDYDSKTKKMEVILDSNQKYVISRSYQFLVRKYLKEKSILKST